MLVRLVRHACAGSREGWDGDDVERPLDAVGRDQAARLAELLAPTPAGRLLSSATRRCTETLAPLADRWGVPVGVEASLALDAPTDALLELVTARPFDGDVLCTHGEAMTKLLDRFDGVPVVGARGDLLAKGTGWDLTVRDGRVVALRHLVPSSWHRCGEHADTALRS